ncbi:hypothetical protein FH972_026808 [Carpinus fangiana]|uniref:Uncharacterized protein n=1 Tax=Carpinus fangiana TaxID=176857 RepID=A0A5N6L529_9ROSI|nr:hypothetical protein FH972_026808 [Carpinus fangiana]
MWSSNEKLKSIDYSVIQAYIDSDGKPFKILNLHPRSHLWIESDEKNTDFIAIACGPTLLGSRIPEWFDDKSTNSFGRIQIQANLGSNGYRKGYALFIVYEFHKPHTTHPSEKRKVKIDEQKGNSNSTTFDGTHPNFPNFVCQFQYQVNGVDVKKPLVVCAPGVPSVGPNGFWVYIPFLWFIRGSVVNRFLGGRRSVEASITTGSRNVEVKECGARLLRDENDASELYQLLNTISQPALGFESYGNLLSCLDKAGWPYFDVKGPIIMKSNVAASGSTGSVNH